MPFMIMSPRKVILRPGAYPVELSVLSKSTLAFRVSLIVIEHSAAKATELIWRKSAYLDESSNLRKSPLVSHDSLNVIESFPPSLSATSDIVSYRHAGPQVRPPARTSWATANADLDSDHHPQPLGRPPPRTSCPTATPDLGSNRHLRSRHVRHPALRVRIPPGTNGAPPPSGPWVWQHTRTSGLTAT